jgi:hypothetical protein
VIAQKCALLHFLSTGFATIEVEERIEVRRQAERRAQKAIRFRSEPFRSPKTALLDRLHLREWLSISVLVFSNLQIKVQTEMGTPPPGGYCEAVKL